MGLRTSRRALVALTVAAALSPAAAVAQFQPVVMKLPAWKQAELAPGNWSGSSGKDLLVLLAGGATNARIFHYRDLLAEHPSPYAPPTSVLAGAVGRFDASSPGALPDVAWGVGAGLSVSWGASPGAHDDFASLFSNFVDGMTAVRMLPRPEPVLIVAAGTGEGTAGSLYAVDLAASRGPPATPPATVSWAVPGYVGAYDGDLLDRAFPLRLSPAAVASGIDDVFVPLDSGFFMIWHDTSPASATVGALDVTAVDFGAPNGGDLRPFLPSNLANTFWWGSCLGGAAMDVDGDGNPDLVFSYGHDLYPAQAGSILWLRNTGDPLQMKGQKPWGSLAGRSDLPIVDAGALRQLDLGAGDPAFAVFDRTLEQIFVVRGDGASGFDVTSLPAPGVLVREMIAADVVGSPAKDLVVLVDLGPLYVTSEVWVYPDDDDLATVLAWDPPLPASAPLGVDLPLGVTSVDPDPVATPFSISWLRPGPPETVAAVGSSWTVPGTALCAASTFDLRVRALDALGVYTQLSASIPVEGRPSVWLAGAAPGAPIVLLPGGADGRVEGEAWPACATGSPTYTWGELGLGGLIETGREAAGSAAAWREFTIPESTYPEALAGGAALVLSASGPTAAGLVTGSTTLPLGLDARGLVSATVSFDQALLADGEIGLARVRLASRIGVPLPVVRAIVRLDGLAFAGPMEVTGAPATLGPGEGELVVDPLPALPAAVELRVPVRSLGRPGAVSVELFSQGGQRISPEASPSAEGAPLPGCGCGDRGAGPLGLLVLLASVFRGRRRAT